MGNTISVGSATSVTEGNPISFKVNTTGVPNGNNLYYRLKGTGATSADFGGLSVINGYVQITTDSNTGIGTGTVTVTPAQDFTIDPGENVYFELYNNQYSTAQLLATSSTVSINDAPYTVAITSDVTTVHEIASGGVTNSVTFTISTTGLNDGVISVSYTHLRAHET